VAVSPSDVEEFCINYLRRTLEIPPEQIVPEASFARLGLDSASKVHLVVEIEDWAGVELDPEAVANYPRIADLAAYVATCAADRGKAG